MATIMTACAQPVSVPTDSPTEPKTGTTVDNSSIVNFFAAFNAGADCATLFDLREEMQQDFQTERANIELRKVSCFSRDSERTTPTTAKAVTSARKAFDDYLTKNLADTTYSIIDHFGLDASWAIAGFMCSDLADGLSPSVVFEAQKTLEHTGNPNLDADIPIFMDHLWYATGQWVCPDQF